MKRHLSHARNLLPAIALALLALLLAEPAEAQFANDGYNPNASSHVMALAPQPDGKTVIGGDFSQVDNQPRSRLARIAADGRLDAGFAANADDSVWVAIVQPDGKILVGGIFTAVNGVTRNRIARLNPDGSLDIGFNPDANAVVYALAIQPDGKILVGGAFTQLGGQTRHRIARLNPDGSLDGTFDPVANEIVTALAVHPDGRILAGGNFTVLAGQTRERIARLNADGSLDTGFNPGASATVWALAIGANGSALVGGDFTQCGSQPRVRLARLRLDGSVDTTFTGNANNRVYSIDQHADGRILLGGVFSQINGQGRSYVARLTWTGSLDTSFDPGTTNAQVTRVAVQPDDKVLMAGTFTQVAGQTRNRIARLHSDGRVEGDLNPGFPARVNSIALQPDGKVLVAGHSLWTPAGVANQPILRLTPAGTVDSSFSAATNGNIAGLTSLANGQILINGAFDRFGGVIRQHFARLNANGGLDSSFNPNPNSLVLGVAVQPDGRMLVAGLFTQIGGQPRSYIARLNATGSLDTSFAPNVTGGYVSAVALQPDGRILIAGDFRFVNATGRGKIARLNANGSLDTTFITDPLGTRVTAIAIQKDGKVVIGGDFTHVSDQPQRNLARLRSNGRLDTGINHAANDVVHTLASQSDGKLLVGGAFTQIGGLPRNRIARLDAAGNLDSGFNPNANHEVWSVTVQPDGKVLAGGLFTQIGGQTRNRIARLSAPEAGRQSLEVGSDRASLRWLRSGASPELHHVWFEQSLNNGSTWTTLGTATRIANGWEWTGALLPQELHFLVRARGQARGGQYNSSGSLIESVRQVYLTAHVVTPSVTGGNGSIAPATPQTVNHGGSISFTLTPAAGHHIAGVTGTCGGALAGNVFTTNAVTANCTVVASFAVSTWMVTPSVTGGNGSIAPATPQTVTHGGSSSFTLTPAAGHHIAGVTGTCGGALAGNVFTTNAVTANCTVVASFAVNTWTVTPSVTGGNGSIAPATPQTVTHGGSSSFTLTPAAGHHIAGVTGTCGGALAGSVFTTNAVTANCTVVASFANVDIHISVDNERDYVRFGATVDYLVTVANKGHATATGLAVASATPEQVDGAGASWICLDPDVGVECTSGGDGMLNTSGVVVPAGRSVHWLVFAPVRSDAPGPTVDYTVSVSGALLPAPVSATDSDVLVLFRNGFNSGDDDGANAMQPPQR